MDRLTHCGDGAVDLENPEVNWGNVRYTLEVILTTTDGRFAFEREEQFGLVEGQFGWCFPLDRTDWTQPNDPLSNVSSEPTLCLMPTVLNPTACVAGALEIARDPSAPRGNPAWSEEFWVNQDCLATD